VSRVIGLVALALLAFVGVAAVQATVLDAGEQFDVNSEEFEPDAGNYTTLDNSRLDGATYDPNPTVFQNNGAVADEGEDYKWNASDGTILVVEGGDLDTNKNATIDYEYTVPTDEQSQLANATAFSFDVAGYLIIVLGAGMVLSMLGVVSRL